MDSTISQAVTALIWQGKKVLAGRRATSNDAWEFPTGMVEPDETSLQACKRIANQLVGVRLSTSWLLDTRETGPSDTPVATDCFVCMMLPGEEPQANAYAELRWLARDELVEVAWLDTSGPIAQMVGTYWDHLFASEHL